MNELPAGAAIVALAYATPGDPMADALEPELVDIDMDQFARMLSRVVAHRLGRLEIAQAVQAHPFRHIGLKCVVRLCKPALAQRLESWARRQ